MPTDQTRDIVQRHNAAVRERDLDALAADYDPDAVMITNLGGVIRGRDAIVAIFAGLETIESELTGEIYDGDVGYVTWTAPGVPFASDTFLITDGRIVSQTVAMHFG